MSSACIKWFPGRVSEGVGRLSVRNVAIITKLINADEVCGFAAPAVYDHPALEGNTTESGRAIWSVNQCELNFDEYALPADCNGVVTTVSGKITVSARRELEGRLTGDVELPVIPHDAKSLAIYLDEVLMENFVVHSSDSDAYLKAKSGTVSAVVKPLLARSDSKGLCAIPTGHVAVENLSYTDAQLFVDSGDRDFDVEVPTSDLHAQIGQSDAYENRLWGSIRVWDKDKEIKGLEGGLNPDYEAQDYVDSFACTEDLAKPISYECPPEEVLGVGGARLAVAALGTLAKLLNADESCGFDTENASLSTQGAEGDGGGTATQQISLSQACQMRFTEPHLAATDCQGNNTWVSGKVALSGGKTIRGVLTGSETEPAVPDSLRAVDLNIYASFDGLTLDLESNDAQVTFRSGALSGTLKPVLARDMETGVCRWPIPRAQIENLTFANLEMVITQGAAQIGITLNGGALEATNGQVDGSENRLLGTFNADGVPVELGAQGEPLNPDYVAADFVSSYDCSEEWELVGGDEDCSLGKLFADSGARLLVKAFGKAFDVTNRDSECGFESVTGLIPADLDGSIFDDAMEARWDIDGCTISHGAKTLVDTDCLGTDTYMEGSSSISASRYVAGAPALGMPPVEPQDRESVNMVIHSMHLQNYSIYEVLEGADEPEAYLQIHEATLSGRLNPITGEAADKPGVYYIKSDAIGFEDIGFDYVDATLVAAGKRFNFELRDGQLNAFNGHYNENYNSLHGQLKVDGKLYSLSMELNPEYDQEKFDAAYVCRENLKETVPTSE
ncbi:MAG: hypothetical protein QGI45_03060 [Myxococcota bacterium]|nr:hypothetical protein [Myxococcota bacterium]